MTRIDESTTRTESIGTGLGALARVPQLLLVVRCDAPTEPGAVVSLSGIEEVVIGRGGDGMVTEGPRVAWSLPDDLLSRRHARVRRERSGWVLADLGSKNGTFRAGQRVTEEHLRDGDLVRVGSAIFSFRFAPMRLDGASAVIAFDSVDEVTALDTLSTELAGAWREADILARTALPLLITGETGVGKELVARELHARSGRGGDFVALNCGAIPESLVESELFGHRKGAFSGADMDKLGMVRRADGGTLFLDEIAELSAASQVALLRVLQESEVRPVGATDPIAVNVRFMAATHRDLAADVEAGRFRQDLLSRLEGHRVFVPPLRKRREDIGLLISRMLGGSLAPLVGARFSPRAIGTLLNYDFPHNVRELEHLLLRAHSLAQGELIRTQHLPSEVVEPRHIEESPSAEDLERRLIKTLQECGGNVSETARRFGKAPIQVRRWCRRFAIDVEEFRK